MTDQWKERHLLAIKSRNYMYGQQVSMDYELAGNYISRSVIRRLVMTLMILEIIE